MRAVLIAATLAAIAVPAYAAADIHVLVLPNASGVLPNTPALERALTAVRCQMTAQKADYEGSAQFKNLDELPWGLIEHAVLRSVDGCPVREVVYQGQTYWVRPAAAGTIERVQPLTGQRMTRQR
jgi:hypothetical protein